MSKIDAQRAMREAKYARQRASGPTRREAAAAAAAAGGTPTAADAETPKATADDTTKADAVRKPSAKPARAATVAPVTATPDGDRCGHKSMNGRACTRESGHSEKSHRYS